MNFSNNLIELRKKANLTQEELSEKLGVSRQAVSKWESNSAFPELDKINQISKLFNCDLDTLINGKIVQDTNLKDKTSKHFAWFGNLVGIATMIIVFGISIIVYFDALNKLNDNVATIIFMVIVTIAVGLYMFAGMKHEFYLKENTIDDLYKLEDEKEYNKKFVVKIISGVILILLSVIIVLITNVVTNDNDFYTNISSGIMLDIIAIAIYQLITARVSNSRFDKLVNDKVKNKPAENLKQKVTRVIMMLTTAIYLFLGFAYHGFGTYWYLFIVGGIACSIASVIIDNE